MKQKIPHGFFNHNYHNPYERFKFQPKLSAYERMLGARFLNEFGMDIPETFPLDVKILSFNHQVIDYKEKPHRRFLKICYEVDKVRYQASAEFNYHLNPKPDLFTTISKLNTSQLPRKEPKKNPEIRSNFEDEPRQANRSPNTR